MFKNLKFDSHSPPSKLIALLGFSNYFDIRLEHCFHETFTSTQKQKNLLSILEISKQLIFNFLLFFFLYATLSLIFFLNLLYFTEFMCKRFLLLGACNSEPLTLRFLMVHGWCKLFSKGSPLVTSMHILLSF